MKRTGWHIRLVIITAICCYSLAAIAQRNDITAMMDSLASSTSDIQKVDLMNSIAEKCLEFDLNRAVEMAEDAKELGLTIDYKAGVADANRWLGKGKYSKGNTPDALDHFMSALVAYQDLADSVEMADIYKNLANVYSSNSNNREAMRYYTISMGIYRSMKDREGESAILNNIGTIYLNLGNADSALFYLNQSRLSNEEINNTSSLATNYTNMGFAHAIKEDYPQAIEYYQKSYELAKQAESNETISTALLNIGDSYMCLKEYSKAEQNVRAGLEISEEEGYLYNTYIGYYTLGEINERRGDFEESLEWFHKAEDIDLELRSSATLNALMDVQSTQLEEAQTREIERVNALNEEQLQSERMKKLLYLSLALLALVLLLGFTYYFKKQHASMLQIAVQNDEINTQKEQIEQQSSKIGQVNDVLTKRNKRLRELNEDKSYMMSVVAHDLKTPLNQIKGLANVIKLENDNLSPTQKECLESIDVSSTRLKGLVDKILEGKNADKLEANLEIEPVDIEKMASNIINDFKSLAESKKISITTNSTDNGTQVKADKLFLRQVLDNLVSNAIKFSPLGKDVELNIQSDENEVIAEVVDHGPGLTEEDKAKLFQEYAILSAKPTGGESSTGLGLAIAKNYVDKMEGKIWCDSQAGQGASFKVALEKA